MEITKKSKTINSDIGLSIYLVEEGEGHNLQMKSNLGSQDIDLLTDILVQTKIESLSEGSREGKERYN